MTLTLPAEQNKREGGTEPLAQVYNCGYTCAKSSIAPFAPGVDTTLGLLDGSHMILPTGDLLDEDATQTRDHLGEDSE